MSKYSGIRAINDYFDTNDVEYHHDRNEVMWPSSQFPGQWFCAPAITVDGKVQPDPSEEFELFTPQG